MACSAAPRLAPRKTPPPATAPRATAPAHSMQHQQRICRRSQAPAHSAAALDTRSVPPRFSDVSCVILPRLGASDAAPAELIALPALTTAPGLAPSQNPTTRSHPPQPTACNMSSAFAGVRKHPLPAQLPSIHAAYHGGSATSAASFVRDSVPATLPHHLRSYCLPAPPPLGPPSRKPPPPATALRASALAHSMQHHQRIA
jgi:hypothetical protein